MLLVVANSIVCTTMLALANKLTKEGIIMKLIELKDGQKAQIISIKGDRRYLSRITSIGLNIGCHIEMIQNIKARPLLIYGRDTMIALDRNESEQIFVEVV